MDLLELKKVIRICFDKLQTDQEINSVLLSAYLIKSLVRGDFVSGKSDIDIFLIFKNSVPYEKQAEFALKLTSLVKDSIKDNPDIFGHYRDCDILYICENEIPKTEIDFLNSSFSIFTAFGFDLEENHELIKGDDILSSFIAPDPLLFADIQIKRLLEKYFKGNLDIVLASGQIMRLLLIKYGLRSLHKQDIRKFVEDNDHIELWLKDFSIKHSFYCYEEKNNKLDFENDCREFLVKVEGWVK